MIIKTCSAPAGAAKTTAMVCISAKLVQRGENALILQPTKQLLSGTAQTLRGLDASVHVEVIHGDTIEGSVGAALIGYLKNPFPEAHVLMATWSAFERLSYFNRRGDWHVFVDEVPQSHDCETIPAATSHRLLTDHIATHSCGAVYSQVTVKDRGAVRRIAESAAKDKALAVFTPLAKKLLSEHWRVYVQEAAYHELLAGRRTQLQTFSVLRPSILQGFKSVTILGARLQETPLFLQWSTTETVRFEEDFEFARRLRYTTHGGGEHVTILYAFEEDWSKNARDKDGKRALSLFTEAVKNEFGDQPFLWMGNKDLEDDHFQTQAATRLPNTPHGRNDFQTHDNVVILSALNPPTAHYESMKWQGIDAEALKTAISRHAVYQAAMRCSIRDPENDHRKRIIVPDRATAEWLQDLLPGSSVQSLGIDLGEKTLKRKPGRRRKHTSDADRKRAHRENERKRLLQELERLSNVHLAPTFPDGVACETSQLKNTCDENPYKELTKDFVSRFYGSIWGHKEAVTSEHMIADYTSEQFIALLKELSRRELPSKERNKLISPAYFVDREGVSSTRSLANVAFANGIWLDFDGGDLTPKRFSQLFPHVRIVVFSTWSSTKAEPRWRAYLPLAEPVPPGVYKEITAQIVKAVIDAGFPLPKRDNGKPDLKAHGIDLSKLNASNLFYLPCRAKDPNGSFFRDYKGKGRQPIQPEDWIRYSILEPTPQSDPVCNVSVELTEDQIAISERLWSEWESEGTQPGKGDRGIWTLFSKLRRAGISVDYTYEMLYRAAASSSSPEDRKRQVDNLRKRFSV